MMTSFLDLLHSYCAGFFIISFLDGIQNFLQVRSGVRSGHNGSGRQVGRLMIGLQMVERQTDIWAISVVLIV